MPGYWSGLSSIVFFTLCHNMPHSWILVRALKFDVSFTYSIWLDNGQISQILCSLQYPTLLPDKITHVCTESLMTSTD